MIQLAIADDHTLFAKGIQGLLDEHADIEVAGIFKNGLELLDFLNKNKVDIVMTDLNMPQMDGMEVLVHLKNKKRHEKIIILSMYDDEAVFKKCMKHHADAFILKDADPDELIFTIREVYEGRHLISFDRVKEQVQSDEFLDSYRQKYRLSRRELQIIRLIKDGKTSKEIAAELFLSQGTIETHRKNIYLKLEVNSKVDLVNKAYEMNL